MIKVSKTAALQTLITTLLISIFTAQPASAQLFDPGGGGNGAAGATPVNGTDFGQIGTVLVNIIEFLVGISAAVMVIMIIVSGIRMILSMGDPKALQAARGSLTFAVIGLILILLAVTIILLVGGFLGVGNLNQLIIPGPGKPI